MQSRFQHPQDVAVAQRIPGIDDGILGEADVEAGLQQLVDPGHAATLGKGVEAALQVDALGRAGDEVDAGVGQQAEQLGAVGVVVGAHGGGVAGGDPRTHAAAACLFGQHLEKARVGIVGLVAMDVHQAAGALGQVHEEFHRAHALVAGVFEVRDAADHIRAQANGFLHQLAPILEGLDALLGKGDDLQVDQVGGLLAYLEHGLECGQRRIGDVDVGAHVLDAMGGQGADGACGAGLGVFLGDGGLALAPALDALEQGAAHVPARLTGGQGGVEVDVRLDEGRHHQVASGVDVVRPYRRRHELLGDGGDESAFEADVIQAFAVTQAGVEDAHGRSPRAKRGRRHDDRDSGH